MTPKETAAATVEKFFKLLGCKALFLHSNKEYKLISAVVYDCQGRYSIFATAFECKPGLISVNVHDFEDDAKRDYILDVSRTTPELAAKFTKEAINAYEQELAE